MSKLIANYSMYTSVKNLILCLIRNSIYSLIDISVDKSIVKSLYNSMDISILNPLLSIDDPIKIKDKY